MTSPPHSHARLALEDKILAARLAGSLNDDLIRVVVTRDNRRILLVPPDGRFSPFSVGLFLRFGALDGVPGAALAPFVLAVGTFVASAEG